MCDILITVDNDSKVESIILFLTVLGVEYYCQDILSSLHHTSTHLLPVIIHHNTGQSQHTVLGMKKYGWGKNTVLHLDSILYGIGCLQPDHVGVGYYLG